MSVAAPPPAPDAAPAGRRGRLLALVWAVAVVVAYVAVRTHLADGWFRP